MIGFSGYLLREKAMVIVDHRLNIQRKIVVDRDEYIIKLVRNKDILHLGCVDSGFTEERFLDGSLLHVKFLKVCNKVYGVDIDCDGVSFLTEKGINDLHCVNIVDDKQAAELDFIGAGSLDFIVVGEVLEHLSNPGDFIRSVSALASKYGAKVIFTVPNAFALFRFKKLLFGVEHVHEDHVRYYSPRTIELALYREGMSIEIMHGYIRLCAQSNVKARLKKAAYRLLGRSRSAFADGLIVVAEPR